MAKITGKEGSRFEGNARVFDGEKAANVAIGHGLIKKGDVIVIRYEGPKGAPGMPEMLAPTGALVGLTQANPEPATGLLADFRYTRRICAFAPGDLFLGFTDGVIEAPDAGGQFYGEERLIDLLQRNPALGGEALCTLLVSELAAFGGRTVFDDDVCVVAIEATGTTCVFQPVTYDI